MAHRASSPDDYVTLTCGFNYKEFDVKNNEKDAEYINKIENI